MPLLEVSDLCVNYGAIKAVKGISFSVERGEIVTLVGANGAGKSTTLNTIAGLIGSASGSVVYEGRNIANAQSSLIVKSGITLAPEGRQVFPRMTVRGNLEMGAYTQSRKNIEESLEQNYELFPILKERSRQLAGTLSGGEQQMLAVARALMSKPKLLLLDEPSLGLAPLIIKNIFSLIRRINKLGTTILLVEQNARQALSISDKGYVLETGKIVMSDTGVNLTKNPRVIASYLGGAQAKES
jgi:branched-chain amino acid transport system ATP-binding protein